MLQDWKNASEEKGKNLKNQQNGSARWCKPPTGWIKINRGASCILGRYQVGVRSVVRDDYSRFLRARSGT